MSALHEFQRDFARAVFDPHPAAYAQFGAGLAVYQNTVAKGLVDVLRANFPTVLRLVGDECFDSVALCYAREQPPRQPALALYGVRFPEFLRDTAPSQLLYLGSVAELDRLWTEAHFAADAPVLRAEDLAALSSEQLGAQTLRLHPATRFMHCPHSAVTIWCANRLAASPEELEIVSDGEAVLITRPHGQVRIEPISLAAYEFLQLLRTGATLGMAANTLLMADARFDLATTLAMLLLAGTFSVANVEQ